MSALRVVAAVLLREGRVLAARRPLHKSQGGLWELPGGKVEPGESDAAALRRELHEELGIRVEVDGYLAESRHGYPGGDVLLVALQCRLVSGEPRPHEHSELRWLDAAELGQLAWAPADVPLLDALAPLLAGQR